MKTKKEKKENPKCEKCGTELSPMMFMGLEPDGFVCEKCSIMYDPDGKTPLAKVF